MQFHEIKNVTIHKSINEQAAHESVDDLTQQTKALMNITREITNTSWVSDGLLMNERWAILFDMKWWNE